MDLRANTAVDVLIGPFVNSTDGNTTEDGLTISQADIKLSKNGQALAQKNDDTDAAFDDDGYYNCELDATDLNTEGNLVLIVHETGALPVRHEYNVLSAAAWDSLYAPKDAGFMDVNVKAVSEDETAADNLEAACDNYSVTRGLTGTALPAAAADAAGGLVISDAGGLDLDTQLAETNEVTAARMAALTDWINGERLDSILDIIAADVVNIDGAPMRGTDGANTTVPNAAGVEPTAAEIRQEIDSNSTKVGYSLSATGLDLILSTATSFVAIAKAIWDAVLTGATFNIINSAGRRLRQIQEAGGYEGGFVWVDTINGISGTTPFDNGTITAKCLTFAEAIAVAGNAALNIKQYSISSDSTITLAATINDRVMVGHGWDLVLDSQNIAGLHIIDAEISGISSGSDWEFHDSRVTNLTADAGTLHNCSIMGTTIFTEAGQYHIHNCHAGDGGTDPIIDTGAAIANTILLMHGWQGAFELRNLGAVGSDIANIAGDGKLTINANCVDGVINLHGNWEVIGAAAFLIAGGTINYDDDTSNIQLVLAETAAILIDTNELQGDWTNDGRLDVILDAILDDTGTSGVVLTVAERNAIADAMLDRDMSTGSDSGSPTVRTVRQALRANRNKVGIAGGIMTVTKEDDVTASWTAAITTTAGDPISDLNPSGP